MKVLKGLYTDFKKDPVMGLSEVITILFGGKALKRLKQGTIEGLIDKPAYDPYDYSKAIDSGAWKWFDERSKSDECFIFMILYY